MASTSRAVASQPTLSSVGPRPPRWMGAILLVRWVRSRPLGPLGRPGGAGLPRLGAGFARGQGVPLDEFEVGYSHHGSANPGEV